MRRLGAKLDRQRIHANRARVDSHRRHAYALEYDSSRNARTQYEFTVNLGSNVPASASRIELGVGIAGQFKTLTFPPQANQTLNFVWDGTGWTVSAQNFYDPNGQTIYEAGGQQRSATRFRSSEWS